MKPLHIPALHTDLTMTHLPVLIQQLYNALPTAPNQAYCLNTLRALQIQFLNLGNIIYCQQQSLLLIFKDKYLYAYEQMIPNTFLNP